MCTSLYVRVRMCVLSFNRLFAQDAYLGEFGIKYLTVGVKFGLLETDMLKGQISSDVIV